MADAVSGEQRRPVDSGSRQEPASWAWKNHLVAAGEELGVPQGLLASTELLVQPASIPSHLRYPPAVAAHRAVAPGEHCWRPELRWPESKPRALQACQLSPAES